MRAAWRQHAGFTIRGFLFATTSGLSIIGALILAIAWLSLPSPVDPSRFLDNGKRYSVEVLRDEFGVPHIYGQRDADVAFGLGYAHAEDDFATIQGLVLATRGVLAAEHGAKAAPGDYLIRLLGVWPAVDSGYLRLIPPATRAIAEAYADGLNLYAAEHPQAVSRYLLPVSGRDIVAGFPFKLPLFFGLDKTIARLMERPADDHVQGKEFAFFGSYGELPVGSQGIAVAPRRSADGHTRLLVNSHQPLTGPVAWYEARLHSEEGWNMAGSTFPGAPLILHGHNARLGWANTVNAPDLIDVYRLVLNPDNADQYQLDGHWRDFEHEDVAIQVKLLGPLRWTFHKTLKRSAHGPVLETPSGSYALRWAGIGEIRALDALYRLNRAESFDEFKAQLARQILPSVNYVYADHTGKIAHFYNAMIPLRQPGIDWSGVLPGDRSELIWNGYVPFDALPRTVAPASGLVYNANNSPFNASDGDDDPDPGDFSPTMGVETQWTNRARRIETLYGGDPSITEAEFLAYKFDNGYDPRSVAGRVVAELLGAPIPANWRGTRYETALAQLRGWDLRTDRDSRTAALGMLTVEPSIMADFNHQPLPVAQASFVAAVDALYRYYGRIDVPFGEVNRHVRGTQSWPISGGPDTLRAVYGGPLDEHGHFVNHAGDSYVMLVDWDQQGRVHSQAIHAFGSATLDTSSPHYADQAPLFVAEKLRPVWFERAELEQRISRRYRPGR